MKLLFIFISIFTSSFVFSQTKFTVSENKTLIRDLAPYKKIHQKILNSYQAQIDSEISRLITGLEYENGSKSDRFAISKYEQLLAKLLVKRILINELQIQLISADLNKIARNREGLSVFKTNRYKLNIELKIIERLDELGKKNSLSYHFISDLKARIIRTTLTDIAIDTFQSIGSGLMAQIIAQGVGSAVFKTALVSLGTDIFVSIGAGTILNVLTFPLHAYRAAPETVWTDILRTNPEMIINPEWMRYAGSDDDPWYTHAYALLRRTRDMEKALDKLLKNEEQYFMKIVTDGERINNYKPEVSNNSRVIQDNTYVSKPRRIDLPPFWAIRKK